MSMITQELLIISSCKLQFKIGYYIHIFQYPDIKIHGTNMGPTWFLWASDGPHVGPMNLTIRVANELKDLYCPVVFSCDQAALQMVFSVCLSVCLSVRLSVCHTFFTMFPSSYHHEIFRSYNHGQKWCPCKRSRSEVKGQGHRGQHPT